MIKEQIYSKFEKFTVFSTKKSITKDPVEYVSKVNSLKYITVNSTFPFPYDLVRAFHEDAFPGLDHPSMNVYARMNSTELDIVVSFLIKIVDEHELRIRANEFNGAIGYSSIIGELLFGYINMVLNRLGKKSPKNGLMAFLV